LSSLDNYQFSFNGLAEYLVAQSMDENFVMQARFTQVEDSNGDPVDATVVSAIAVKYTYPTIVPLNESSFYEDTATITIQVGLNDAATGKWI
jgi:ferritin